MKKRIYVATGIVLSIILIDQITKWYIKTHFMLGEEYKIFNWFYIHFTENPGMAFGLTISNSDIGKLILSLLRLIAAFAIGWYLIRLIKEQSKIIFITAISFVWAGAVGNIIDSLFYGIIYSSSEGQFAQLFPAEGGYSSFLYGKVVDMLYFPLIEGHFPSWFPIWANEPFIFFRPVFNIADSSITIGVLLIILFYNKIFPKK